MIGSKQGQGSEYYHNKSGKVHVITSSSVAGWTQEKLSLSGLGLNNNVVQSEGIPSPYGDQEHRNWDRFAYKSCVVSGSYIAAAAQGVNVPDGDSVYHRRRHSVFILKSGSVSGWAIEQRIDDPAADLTLSAANMNDTSDTEFGTGLAFGTNSIIINSGKWKDDWSSSKTLGRSYVYVSSSENGWTLDQTIDNPYSGSIFQESGVSGKNMKMSQNSSGGWPNAGGVGYGAKPAVSGCVAALNGPEFTYWPDPNGSTNLGDGVRASSMKGAVIVINGSENYIRRIAAGQGGEIPMQLGMFRGAPNLRGQTAGNAYYVEKSNTTLKN